MNAYFALFTGRYIVHHGLPHTNVFTVANAGRGWIDQQWLAHVVFYGVWSVGGYRALALVNVGLISGGMTAVAWLLIRRGVSPVHAAAWSLVAYVGAFTSTEVRPQSFAFALFPLLLSLILGDADVPEFRRRTTLLLPLLVLWSNLHGSAIMAVPIVVFYALFRAARTRRWAYALLAVAAAATPLVTPYGVGGLRYYSNVLGNASLRHNLPQWGSPSIARADSWPFFVVAAVVIVAVGFAWRRGSRVQTTPAVLAMLTFVQASRGERFGVWFALTGVVAAATALEPVLLPWRARPVVRDQLFGACVAILAVLVVWPLAAAGRAQFETLVPRGAVDAAAHAGTRVLGDETTATPLLWLHPEVQGRVAFDVRFEQYAPAQIDRYFDFIRHGTVIAGFDVVVIDKRAHPKLASAMASRRDWRVVFEDHDGIVAVQR